MTGYYELHGHATIRKEGVADRIFDNRIEGANTSGVAIADPDYFTIFKYDWLAGNEKISLLGPFKVVLTESRARKYFGPVALDKMIGRTVLYEDSLKVTVSGIVKDWSGPSDFRHTDFISISTIQTSFLNNARHRMHIDWKDGHTTLWPYSFVKLARGVKPEAVDARFAPIVKSNMMDPSFYFELQPLSDIHFNTDYREDIRKAHLPTLYSLIGIAAFILVLAVINFINLSTAQSIQRAKEIGVRKVLGSTRTSLVFQFLTETFVVTLFAGGIAVLLVNPMLSLFNDFIPAGVVFHLFRPGTLLFIGIVTALTSLLAGFYPAKVLSAYLPVLSLKGGGVQKGGEKWWLRKGLIVFQFSISLLFIIGSIVIGRQIDYMLNTDFGFKTDARLSLGSDWGEKDISRKQQVLTEKLSRLPGVEKVVLQGDPPTGWGMNGNFITHLVRDQQPKQVRMDSLRVDIDFADDAFIPFYGMRIVAGRNVLKSDSLRELVINETCSKDLGFKRPGEALGQLLGFQGKILPVVGVVADFHEGSFHDAIRPLIIAHEPREEGVVGILLASKGKQAANIKATLAAMEKIWKELYPRGNFEYVFPDRSIAAFYDAEQKTSLLMRAAMIITIFISCLGLFGLALFTAQLKTKEVGIRKVLGASVADITVLLTRDFVWLVVIALLIASPVAWFLMNKWLENFAYRIPVSAGIFAAAGLGAIGIALVTVSFQAIKAAVANPVKSLRTDY